jgi:hypothetical protein
VGSGGDIDRSLLSGSVGNDLRNMESGDAVNGPGFDAKTAAEFDKTLDPPELSEVSEEEIQDAEDRYQEDLCERFKSGDL